MDSVTPLFAEERKEKTLQLLEEKSKIYIADLCTTFGVSSVTIRNDLRELEAEGRLKRTHGGAIRINQASFEPTSPVKEIDHIEQKRQIAQHAASLIDDGDTIALDTGTTTLELAKCLINKQHIKIITNDIKIASVLETHNSSHEIILTGGVLRQDFHCLVGPLTLSSLTHMNVDKAFIAANAFSIERGFSTPDLGQAQVKKALMDIAAETVMLMDSSKIGRFSFSTFARLQDVDKVIIDHSFSAKTAASLREADDSVEWIMI